MERIKDEHPDRIKRVYNKRIKENKNKYKWTTKNNPEKLILQAAKQRALKKNIEFNLKEIDILIPDECPVLGIKLIKGIDKLSDNSPSIDRIDNNKGYTKDNILIVSYKVNAIKRNASIEELGLIYEFYKDLKTYG